MILPVDSTRFAHFRPASDPLQQGDWDEDPYNAFLLDDDLEPLPEPGDFDADPVDQPFED